MANLKWRPKSNLKYPIILSLSNRLALSHNLRGFGFWVLDLNLIGIVENNGGLEISYGAAHGTNGGSRSEILRRAPHWFASSLRQLHWVLPRHWLEGTQIWKRPSFCKFYCFCINLENFLSWGCLFALNFAKCMIPIWWKCV